MTKPNFLIIGSPKCGTTSLYNYLGQHPNIVFSDVKEPKYFSFKDVELSFNGNDTVLSQLKQSTIQNIEDYLKLFDNKIAKYIGEASPNYFHYEPSAKNIYDFDSKMKLIVILRNPVDRLYSDWKHNVRMGFENECNFKKAIKLIEKRRALNAPPYFDYLEKGYYAKHLKRYYKLFNKDQIKVVFLNDLKNNANVVCNDIAKFLGICEDFNFKTSKIYMESYPIIKKNFIYKYLPLISKFSYSLYKYLKEYNTIPEEMPIADATFILDFYKEDIKELERLIEKDLSNWYIR